MAILPGVTPIEEAKKAAAYALAVDAADLQGYVVVGVLHDDSYLITANLPNNGFVAATLADVASQTMADIADGMPRYVPT